MNRSATDLIVNEHLSLPRRELWFEFSHSSGPGGQNVNKVESVATLCFCPAKSGALSTMQKQKIIARLGNRIGADGVLRITSRESRSQHTNRSLAETRLAGLLSDALKPRKSRKPTRPTRASRQKRLDNKKHRSEVKKSRNSLY